ncbi:hypothetical protein IJI72_00440 [Candidatus Saccharibacteria bacterium]|nr:hypothetical protein [Candidatus Saccharibacteria bacterium]
MLKSLKRLVLSLFICALCAVLGFVLYRHRVDLADYFKARSYVPSTEMAELRDALDLTEKGTRIFNASTPLLDSRDDFNRDCNSSDPGIAVYGCYYLDTIYVYNIDSAELAGIRESTTAHELLHAVWARLSGIDKNRLVPLLESVYAEHKTALDKTLETYDESERLDELYVRIGTQIKTLPAELESHYAEIFSDQDKIVAFYDTYITPFNTYSDRIAALGAEMETLKSDIEAKTAAYESASATFGTEVAEFNSCAATVGCFSSQAAFNSRRAELVATQASLDSTYSDLSALIDVYNQKVDEYNSNILNLDLLQNLANSNGKTESIKE